MPGVTNTKRPRRAAVTTVPVLPSSGVEVVHRPEETQERDWAGGLFPELVCKIADHLLDDDVSEYIRLRAVCKPWGTSTVDPRLQTPVFFPRNWLLLAGPSLRHDGKPERFVNVRTGATLRIRIPDHHMHCGNAEGLLVLHNTYADTIHLFNPLTTTFYNLPTMLAVNDVARHDVEYPHEFFSDSIMATGIVVDVDALGSLVRAPTVVLSLTEGNRTVMVCTEAGNDAWRAVDMSCTDDIEGAMPLIKGGLSFWGQFYIPTCTGDVLKVELDPQPHLRYVARMTDLQIRSGFNMSSYLVPSCDNDHCGMLLVRLCMTNDSSGYTKYVVDLSNRSLSLKKPSGVTVFLPSVTIRSSAFPLVSPNAIYWGNGLRRFLRGDYI